MKAIWNDKVIAESDKTVIIEGNHYFPVNSVNPAYLRDSQTHTICHWKGTASYYHIEVEGMDNRDAAWYYPDPSDAAEPIRDHIAFWKGVEVLP
ncbi:MAG: DUF427 domain-containing protein [Candidatus Marinimicrobia bacterium]|nr:DUF427 domain-containing protein [Candidatus Neomarinimicrobiota bacterium]